MLATDWHKSCQSFDMICAIELIGQSSLRDFLACQGRSSVHPLDKCAPKLSVKERDVHAASTLAIQRGQAFSSALDFRTLKRVEAG